MTNGRPVTHDDSVSVIIPTVSQARHLAACLVALRRAPAPPPITLDIVVVLNGATADVRAVAMNAPDVRVVESAVNRGFAGGCHLGVRTSTAPWIVLLNDDVQVRPGWLEPLMATMCERPRAAAVGPRVLGRDGRVQEIGSVIWRDGTTRPIGRGLPASSLAWRWRRRVDYASGCALLVRREAWDRVGGFDTEYHPAYYEDVDFCLALEAAGYEVWVDPRGDVVHAESASSNPAFKAFLFERHHARLVSRWPQALAGRVAAPMDPRTIEQAMRDAGARLAGPRLRVLVVDSRVPAYGLGSGFDRMADIVLALAEQGADVRVLPTQVPAAFNPELAAAGVAVLEGPLDDVLAHQLRDVDVVLVSRPVNAMRVHDALRRVKRGARPRYVYDAEALFHRRSEREAALKTGMTARLLQAEAVAVRRTEARVASNADVIVCVSREEAAFFASHGARTVHVRTPWLRKASLTSPTLRGRADIGLVAGWLGGAWSPNGDALAWFASRVMPRITAVVPWVRLRVTGTLPPELRPFEGLNLTSVGFVDDLAEFYGGLRVAVAPIRYGAGVKLKTVEALQYGVPIVATTVGAEGLDELRGGAIAVHDAPEAFADAVIARLVDVAVWRRHRAAIETAMGLVQRDPDWKTLLASPSEGEAIVRHAV